MQTKIYDVNELNEIVNALNDGQIIAFPTDTVFGLGCLYDLKEAILKIKEAKNRNLNKSLPMMCSGLDMIQKVAITNSKSESLIKELTPGALTLILKKKDDVPSFVTDGKSNIAIRIPDDPWILSLLNKLNKPMLVTSANISNNPSLQHFEDVYASLNGRIDGIVKGEAKSNIASTIVDTTNNYQIIREGKIKASDIKSIIERVEE